MAEQLKLPENPYDHSSGHCQAIHERLMSHVASSDEDVSLKAIKMGLSLTYDLLHLAADPRIAELMESREAVSAARDAAAEPKRKLSRLKVVG